MIKKVFLAALLIVLVSVLLLTAYILSLKAETPSRDINLTAVLHDERYQNQAAAAEQWLQSLYQHQLLPSIAAAIGIDGELVWEGTMGFADIDNGLLANSHTQYRIGSISKAMTAVAAMRMQEKNLLDINAPFNTHVKDYAASHANITLKQLLSHQAGIRHYVNQFSENFSNTQYASTREAAAIVEHDPLLFAPGESFHYSTYGYTLAALAMENAYAVPFEKIMYNEVFTPTAMTATTFAKSGQPAQHSQAVPYLHIGDSLFQSPSVNFSNKYAGGGYLSTPSDVVRFANALLNQTLLTKAATETLWTPVALNNGATNPENYALGFRVGQDDKGRFVHHGGKSVGGYSFLLIYPELKIVVAFASNVTPSSDIPDRLQAAKKLAALFITIE